jgi:hypothetical protein
MKKIAVTVLALAIGSGAVSDELQNLIDASNTLKNQLDTGIRLVGAATEYSYTGTGLSDGSASSLGHISSEQLKDYNDSLTGMSTYLPFGDLQTELETRAQQELVQMEDAVDVFTEAVVEMSTVVQVAEMAESASTPKEEEQVQNFVGENIETLQISSETVETYNQSIDDIEEHANNASAFLAIAGNKDAVEFFEQGIENANTTAEETNIFYNANSQWVAMGYNTTRNLTAIYLNGTDGIGLDLYLTDAEILLAGAETDYYLTGPTANSYDCFVGQGDCE